MHVLKIICFCSVVLLFPTCLLSQSYYFRHYSVENGLSNNTVLCSLQDKMGFLWFGTKDGLNRFDGYSFKTFRKNAGKPGSIGNNLINSLFEDEAGTLWVGTDKGIYQYLEKTENFRLMPATSSLYIEKIEEDLNNNLWFISGHVLYRYARETDKLESYDQQNFFVATSICTTPDGTVWVGTSDGLLKRYHPESNSFSSFNLFSHSKPTASKWIESLYITSDGYLLAGTSHTEIKMIDPFRSTYKDISLPNSGQSDLYIRTILQTAPNEFWLGTESGVFIYNTKSAKCLHLNKEYNNPYSITDNAVYNFCRDRQGGVWVGTYFGGINYLPNRFNFFTKYFPKKGENSISGNVVREIKQDHYGNIWIGTEDAGLNKLDTATGKFTHFKPDGTAGSLSFFNIHGLLPTGNELWVGTFNHGLDILNIRTGKVIRHYKAGPVSGLSHNFIYSFYQTHSGQILTSSVWGTFIYDRKKNYFKQFEGLPFWNWYTSVLEDERGTIWAGTFGQGLFFYNPKTKAKGNFLFKENDSRSLSSNRVNSVFEDSNHHLWIATEEGLCKWNAADSNFVRYGVANGFPSDFILCMLEDQQHNLWMSTTKGLVCFTPSTQKIQVYTTANGLLSDQFNYNSAFKDATGRMYFGSAKGLISFRPEKFKQNKFVPPVFITGFQVNNQELTINQRGSPLKQSIAYTDKIILHHHQSTFSIDFAALSYTAPEMMKYTYRMEGLSKNWVNLKTNRKVFFTELPPGSYTFRVKAFSDGTWSPRDTKMTIIVLPPWWASTWAYTVYILLALLLIFYLVRSYHQRMAEKNRRKFELLKMEKEKEILKMELAKEKEILQAKIEFFTNVAHEIRTPLTLIKVPLRKVIKKAGNIPEIENSLKIMDRNTTRLVDLTNQLLDFRQTEINRFHLTFERADITGLVAEACAGFTSLAEQNNISLSLHLPKAPLFAFVDMDAFNKIIYNLFSNAVKYAKSKVEIALLPRFKNNTSFSIRVKNDGYLIPEELKEKIFEPFFRIRETESQTGTGIGLALSRSLTQLHNGLLMLEPQEGNMNIFTVTLPIHQETEFVVQNKMQNFNPPNEGNTDNETHATFG